VLLNDATRI